jgi:hypothetical protein
MKKKKIENIKITISLTHVIHRALLNVRATYGMSQSEIIRTALNDVDYNVITKGVANSTGGGYFRTVANITSADLDMIQHYSYAFELNKSAVIRAALLDYLYNLAKRTASNKVN